MKRTAYMQPTSATPDVSVVRLVTDALRRPCVSTPLFDDGFPRPLGQPQIIA